MAIEAPDRGSLTYAELLSLIDSVGGALRSAGVGCRDTVALVVPNGPEAAAAFVAISSAATVAPLNPGYQAPELEFYLDDLDAAAVVVAEGMDSPAAAVAASRGIPVIWLKNGGAAGSFELVGLDSSSFDDPAGPDDIALVLHTSGTTSRPKQVPLRHRNVTASATSIASGLGLSPDDRCLNVMPLFHIHGLMAAVLASLTAGGSVVCTPGFFATDFFGWMRDSDPTWYTAVPTMHQAILERAGAASDVIAASRLRFARSSSSSMPPTVMAGLEGALGVPLIEAYGMTEASHQMASNPLPPEERKPGSVGPASGPEVAVMDAEGRMLPSGVEGEIVIRGPGVIDGYAGNPEANATAFNDGWFRTGDLGRLDSDGYLFITGRIKEIINRGGETISPREIDEALLAHPGVAQALAFAVPDSVLGEQVAAVVVTAPGPAPEEGELRSFVGGRLSAAKVPRRVLFMDEIPKGPTGKLQRIGLAERLGLADLDAATGEAAEYEAPSTQVETLLAGMWSEVLGVDRVGRHDRFLDIGGDSMLAMRLLGRVRDALGVQVSVIDFFERPSVADQAVYLEDLILADEAAL